jgi:hypothetical protein
LPNKDFLLDLFKYEIPLFSGLLRNDGVVGSSPPSGTIAARKLSGGQLMTAIAHRRSTPRRSQRSLFDRSSGLVNLKMKGFRKT